MTNDSVIVREHDVLFQTYKRLPIVIDRAEGARIFDADGNVYLDMLGGIAVNALGHSHPRVVDAVVDQARRYMHVSNFFYQEPQVRLAAQRPAMTACSSPIRAPKPRKGPSSWPDGMDRAPAHMTSWASAAASMAAPMPPCP
jgi:acetylornithine/N-succinyldiaminopimelate aminotransferase